MILELKLYSSGSQYKGGHKVYIEDPHVAKLYSKLLEVIQTELEIHGGALDGESITPKSEKEK